MRRQPHESMTEPCCPECGSTALGINVLVVECRDLYSTYVYSSEETGETEDRLGGFRYTCDNAHDFDVPKEAEQRSEPEGTL